MHVHVQSAVRTTDEIEESRRQKKNNTCVHIVFAIGVEFEQKILPFNPAAVGELSMENFFFLPSNGHNVTLIITHVWFNNLVYPEPFTALSRVKILAVAVKFIIIFLHGFNVFLIYVALSNLQSNFERTVRRAKRHRIMGAEPFGTPGSAYYCREL